MSTLPNSIDRQSAGANSASGRNRSSMAEENVVTPLSGRAVLRGGVTTAAAVEERRRVRHGGFAVGRGESAASSQWSCNA